MTTAIVVGGAVAGLAAARTLRAAEASVTVLERRPAGGTEGAGLLLYPAAARALERLGALDAFRTSAVPVAGIATCDHRGRVLHHLDLRPFAERYGHPVAGVDRADLLAALGAGLTAEVRRGLEVTDVKVRDLVEVRSNRGLLEADILVGADGIRSRVREALGLGADPRTTGWIAWRGICEAPADLPAAEAQIVLGRGRHGGWLPVSRGRVYWFVTGYAGEAPDQAAALAAVESWRSPLPGLVAATPPAAVLYNELIDRDPDTRWGRGPVTLAGDAAHAMLPSMAQGANQALEDAAVLLDVVGRHGLTAAAFRAYEKRRATRTARLVRLSRQVMPVFQWRRLPARWLRARLLALPDSVVERQSEWLYRGDA